MNTELNNQTSNKTNWPKIKRVNDFSPLVQSTVVDDSDLQQRCRREDYRARAEYTSYMTHDSMELARNSNRRHWTGCESLRTDSHPIR